MSTHQWLHANMWEHHGQLQLQMQCWLQGGSFELQGLHTWVAFRLNLLTLLHFNERFIVLIRKYWFVYYYSYCQFSSELFMLAYSHANVSFKRLRILLPTTVILWLSQAKSCNNTLTYYPSAANPCHGNQHGCQHICYQSNGQKKCSCHAGYSLNQDGKTCSGIHCTKLLSIDCVSNNK